MIRPDEDPHKNLTCKDPNSFRSIAQHVESGLRIPSQYISTTSSLEKAKKWLETANEQTSRKYMNERTTIVSIDVSEIKSKYPQIAKSAIDLTDDPNRNYFLETEKQLKFACAYQEVLFVKRIPSEVVAVVYMKDRSRRQESLISRPPHCVPFHNNFGIHNQSPLNDLSSQRRLASHIKTDDYPSFRNDVSSQNTYGLHSHPFHNNFGIRNPSLMNDLSSQCRLASHTKTDDYPNFRNDISSPNTYEPYTNRYTSQSTSPKSTIDHDSLLTFGIGFIRFILVVVILLILVPWLPLALFFLVLIVLFSLVTCCFCCCCDEYM